MTGVVALCHFCEIHGPSVIMVTQSIRDSQQIQKDATDALPLVEDTGVPDKKIFGCKKLFTEQSEIRGCDGCLSLKYKDKFIVSNDHEGKRTFVSSQTPVNKDLLFLLRQVVIRAISCEISANREGPILFSDRVVSSVLANNFFLKDSRARGFQRYYSIIVVAKEKEHLVSNWHNLNKVVNEVIDDLKQMAKTKFNLEAKTLLDLKEKCENFRANSSKQRRDSIRTARSLTELTMDSKIYERIHAKFTTVLSSLEKHLKEKVLTGQPMKTSVIYPKASLETILRISQHIGVHQFRTLLYHLLGGKTIQIKSKFRHLSRQIGDTLCLLLPNNLTRNPFCFANLVLANPDMEDILPQLSVHLGGNSEVNFTFHSCSSARDLSCCPKVISSNIVMKFCKLFSNQKIPKTIQEMSIRSFVEMVLLQARVFMKLSTSTDRRIFLGKNGFTANDEEILTFFQMFS